MAFCVIITGKSMISLTREFLSSVLVCLSLVASGQYETGSARIELRDPARGNRKVTADLWYPVVPQDQAVSGGDKLQEKFPVICFAHGYQHPGDRYGNLVGMIVPYHL
jgi:hypothetical protein